MADILERLKGYNPPDRTVDEQRQIAIDIEDAIKEIESLEKQNRVMREALKQRTYPDDVTRALVLLVKHCPRDHHDWNEAVELSKSILGDK